MQTKKSVRLWDWQGEIGQGQKWSALFEEKQNDSLRRTGSKANRLRKTRGGSDKCRQPRDNRDHGVALDADLSNRGLPMLLRMLRRALRACLLACLMRCLRGYRRRISAAQSGNDSALSGRCG